MLKGECSFKSHFTHIISVVYIYISMSITLCNILFYEKKNGVLFSRRVLNCLGHVIECFMKIITPT